MPDDIRDPAAKIAYLAHGEDPNPVRIFIGSSSNGEDAEIAAVYEYSLRNNSTRELDIHYMYQPPRDQASYWGDFTTQYWSTPFSGFRWAIPEYCGFKGRAIYTDIDMINLRDINELWQIDLRGKPIAARRGQRFGGHEFCVMVMDCEAMQDLVIPVWRQRLLADYHRRMIQTFSGSSHVLDLDPRWNCLDGEDREISDIWQLHWTKMATQPWKPAWFTGITQEHPRQDLVKMFRDMQLEAADAGFTVENYIPKYEPVKYNIIGR